METGMERFRWVPTQAVRDNARLTYFMKALGTPD